MPDREGTLFLLPASCSTNQKSFVSLQLMWFLASCPAASWDARAKRSLETAQSVLAQEQAKTAAPK